MTTEPIHTPVLLKEVLELLALRPDSTVLDCTLGLGGHSEHMLQAIGKNGHLVALDADEKNLAYAKQRLRHHSSQISFIHSNFGEIPQCLPASLRKFDAMLADLGLSSPHIDDPSRGFSFRGNGPLDMRYDTSSGQTAADILSISTAQELTNVFRQYGEFPSPHRLSAAITTARSELPLRTSADIVSIVESCYGYRAPSVLPQVFQALRMVVNNELQSLQSLLRAIPELLNSTGRIAVISYHSLEDRLVKQAFKALCEPEKDEITGAIVREMPFTVLTKRPIIPSDDEVALNPRSRSAKLRVLARK